MANRSLLVVLVLVAAVAAGGTWYMSSGDAAADPGADVLGPGMEIALQPSGDARPDLAAPAQPAEVLAAAPPPAERADALPAAPAEEPPRVPSDVIWLNGRVVFPPDTPEDERMLVRAHGKRFPGRKKAKGVYEAEVGEDGEFRVAFMPKTTRARLTLRARYAYLASSLRFKMDEAPAELVLEPLLGGRVVGRMTLPEPLENEDPERRAVMIEVENWNGGEFIARVVTADASGEWEVDSVPPGDGYQVESRSLAFTQFAERDVRVGAGETVRIDGTPTRGATLRGEVVDGAGRPVEGARVQADTDGRFRSKEDRTDAEGRFEVTGLVPGEIDVDVRHKAHLETKLELADVAEGEVRSDLRFVLEGGGVVEGFVHWPDGSPAVRALVRVDQQQGEGWRYRSDRDNSFKTEEDGAFRFSGLGVEPCTLQAEARPPKELKASLPAGTSRTRWRVLREDVVPDTGRVGLVLEEAQSLAGRVVDDRGEPVPRFSVTLRQKLEGTWTGQQYHRTFKAEDGAFEFAGIAPGAWKVDARILDAEKKGMLRQVWYSNDVERIVQVPQTGDLVLRLERPVRLSGVVHDPAGAPQPGAEVKVLSAGRRVRDATTDSNGAFELTDVAPGALVLTVEHDDHARSNPVELQAPPASEHVGIVLALRTGGILKGEVSPAAGEVAGRSISVTSSEAKHWKQVKSDADGRFEVGGLTGGSYRVQLEEAHAPSLSQGLVTSIPGAVHGSEVVDVVEGQTVHVVVGRGPDDPITVRGRVTAGGEPLAGVTVRAQRSGGKGQPYSGESGPDGAYELVVDGPGTYGFLLKSGPGSHTQEKVDVPAGAVFTRDFELPAGVVTGTVSGPDGPAGNVPVVLTWEREEGRGKRTLAVRTEDDGSYRFAQLAPGAYTLRAGGVVRTRSTELGLAPETAAVEVAASPASAVDFRLGPGGRIEGNVVDASGGFRRGYQVQASVDGGATWTYVGYPRADRPVRAAGFGSGTVLVRARLGGEPGTPVEVRVAVGSAAVFEIVVAE